MIVMKTRAKNFFILAGSFILLWGFLSGCSDDDLSSTSDSSSSSSYLAPPGPFTYNGVEYQGRGTTISNTSPHTAPEGAWDAITVTSPDVSTFAADAFFVMEGSISYGSNYQYSLIQVTNTSVSHSRAFWFVRNDFSVRIWLPFGPGNYRVSIHPMKLYVTNLDFEGEISSFGYSALSNGDGAYTFMVTNTRDEDGRNYYPSWYIQADHPDIQSLAGHFAAQSSGESNTIRLLHNFVVTNLYYDDASLEDGQRKKQNAVATLHNGTAVCEGYTQLYNALLRAAGITAKMVGGSANGEAHAWSEVFYEGSWGYYVDTTWDDPGPNDADPDNLYFTYFMKSLAYFNTNLHTLEQEYTERSGPKIEIQTLLK